MSGMHTESRISRRVADMTPPLGASDVTFDPPTGLDRSSRPRAWPLVRACPSPMVLRGPEYYSPLPDGPSRCCDTASVRGQPNGGVRVIFNRTDGGNVAPKVKTNERQSVPSRAPSLPDHCSCNLIATYIRCVRRLFFPIRGILKQHNG